MTTAADFYRLTPEQLVELEGYGELSAQRTVENIQRSKRAGARSACCSRSGSRRSATITGRNLAARFRSMTRCMDATPEQIEETPGIGTKMSRDHPRAAGRPADARADRRPARAARRMELEGAPPGEGPLLGQDVRAHRLAAGAHARAGDQARARRGRTRHDSASPRRPTTSSPASRRAPSSRRPSAWACPCSTRPGCSSSCRARWLMPSSRARAGAARRAPPAGARRGRGCARPPRPGAARPRRCRRRRSPRAPGRRTRSRRR